MKKSEVNDLREYIMERIKLHRLIISQIHHGKN